VRSNACAPNSAVADCFTPRERGGDSTFASDSPLVQKYMRMRGRWPSGGVFMFALLVPE
jgi:hypothetical protein